MKPKYYIIIIVILLIGLGIGIYESVRIAKQKEVTIITDKKEYEQGETINITVKNNLDKPIWYNSGCNSGFANLEKMEENGWKKIYYKFPFSSYSRAPLICWDVLCGQAPPIKLGPNSEISEQLDLICETPALGSEPKMIEEGIYRFSFVYGLKFVGYISIHDPKVYSKEFIIR